MGGGVTKIEREDENHERKVSYVSVAIMTRINIALVNRRSSRYITPFNKIILQFPMINYCFKNIRKAFDHFDTDGSHTIEFDELQESLDKLGIHGVRKDVLRQIFDESDIRKTQKLSFKEFLIALALIYLLDLVPATSGAKEEGLQYQLNKTGRDRVGSSPNYGSIVTHNEPPPIDLRRESAKLDLANYHAQMLQYQLDTESKPYRSPSHSLSEIPHLPKSAMNLPEIPMPMDDKCDVFDESTKLKRTFELIADGYIQFDKKGQGAIKKSDLREIAYRKKVQIKNNKKREGVDPVNEFLTKERFHELDTRAGELVTFREFLFAFESWVGMDEETIEEEKGEEEEREEEMEVEREREREEETTIEKITISPCKSEKGDGFVSSPTNQSNNKKISKSTTTSPTKSPIKPFSFVLPTNVQPKSAMKRNGSRNLSRPSGISGPNGLKTLKELNDLDNKNKLPFTSSSKVHSQESMMVSAEASKTSPGSVVLNNME